MRTALSLTELNRRVAQALSGPGFQNVWVAAELSDLRINHGHCYMELMEKDPDTGSIKAKLRAMIWASVFPRLNAEFYGSTGQRLESGLKVLVCGSVNYHPAFGMAFSITAIDPSFTMGEAERRRREILQRLQRENVADLNKSLPWPVVAHNIAIISARGAAGYGDFIHQLYSNASHIRFRTKLFEAVMQGNRTSPSVIDALERINADSEQFDCVVIIRGGGATSDLLAFDDYALANNVAQFPLPIIIGIGHERDTTVLDYVANMRVKTPTAAAEWLIKLGETALERLRTIASEIMLRASDAIKDSREHLAYISSALSMAPTGALDRASSRLQQATLQLARTGAVRITPALAQIDARTQALANATVSAVRSASDRLDSRLKLLEALSPQATLARGYSITTIDGKAVLHASQLKPGQEITTTLADGTVISTIK
ncbi:MAG: exodeoxyribonuclease VII large subunit [Bacteroides sp.]|nr:exodeoxyribonuclease VII large subunit [Bacteroides sp.]MCM1413640.1 exodeoxyribonuclease VII large subunit [Bacteroides sp.]MCM1471143.1 exodeoxyribonuclease VII large subunit [Bacteroides sp.]